MAYLVRCPHCGQGYDAEAAAVCTCVGTTRTFLCPHCGRCFCTAPKPYRDDFWKNAPESLYRLRVAKGPAPVPESRAAPGRPLVLVVEDDREVRAFARAALESAGLSVLEAGDGEEGLRLALFHKPDLVLTDALLPRLDGRKLCARLKANPATSSIKVAVMTGVYKSSRYAHEAKAQFGADAYLVKPLDPDRLQEVLLALLCSTGGGPSFPP